MDDPKITNYEKPLTPTEKSDLLPLETGDYDYVLAFKVFIRDATTY